MHDNHGAKDEHLWPGEGNIDWAATAKLVNALPQPPAAVLEIASVAGDPPADLGSRVQSAFQKLD